MTGLLDDFASIRRDAICYGVRCDPCGARHVSRCMQSIWDYVQELDDLGWRVIDLDVCCPNCAKQHDDTTEEDCE